MHTCMIIYEIVKDWFVGWRHEFPDISSQYLSAFIIFLFSGILEAWRSTSTTVLCTCTNIPTCQGWTFPINAEKKHSRFYSLLTYIWINTCNTILRFGVIIACCYLQLIQHSNTISSKNMLWLSWIIVSLDLGQLLGGEWLRCRWSSNGTTYRFRLTSLISMRILYCAQFFHQLFDTGYL